jgi:SAM-dependent methyltransferase
MYGDPVLPNASRSVDPLPAPLASRAHAVARSRARKFMLTAMTSPGFIDAFSDTARRYASARPAYPATLFQFLAELAPARHCAWDCGAGNGQAALGLAALFESVQATDASAQQIEHALSHPRVHYRVAAAEASDLPDRSVDLISVAQALHWFDLAKFYPEALRVARPGCVLAVYGYTWFYLSAQLDALIDRWLLRPIESYWSPDVRLLWHGYRTIEFPFQEITAPRLAMHLSWNLDQLLSYYLTWSATRSKIAAEGERFLADAYQALAAGWGDPQQARTVVMPISARLGRLS